MLQYAKTQSVAEFKQTYGVKSLNIQLTQSGKPFFNTDAGVEGLVSTKSLDALRNKELESVRVSWFTDDESGREGWMIHNVRSNDAETLISL